MHRRLVIKAYRFSQPDEEAWQQVREVVQALGAKSGDVAVLGDETSMGLELGNAGGPLAAEAVATFRHLEARSGVSWREYRPFEWDAEDFAQAAFVVCVGVGLDATPAGPFVVNESEAFGAPEPCPACGYSDVMTMPQKKSLRVREDAVHAEGGTMEGPKPAPPGGWDVVNLLNGGLVVSRRFLGALERTGARGYVTRPVFSAKSGARLESLAQLLAEKAIPAGCAVHTPVGSRGFCPRCGTIYGELSGPVHVRRSDVGGRAVFATVPGPGGHLAFARDVLDALAKAGVNGLAEIEPRAACED